MKSLHKDQRPVMCVRCTRTSPAASPVSVTSARWRSGLLERRKKRQRHLRRTDIRSRCCLIATSSRRHHSGSEWQVAELLYRSRQRESSRSQLCLYHLHSHLPFINGHFSQTATAVGRTKGAGAVNLNQRRSHNRHARETSRICR